MTDAREESVEVPDDGWRNATLISTRRQSRHGRTLTFRVPGWPPHLPGQHVNVRLTSVDGYSAQRRYSIAGPYIRDQVAITVDLRPHGEVSPYLVQTMKLGDQLDMCGPLGDDFVWDPDGRTAGEHPLVLVGREAGIVPLMSILRARGRSQHRMPVLLVYASRDSHSLMYRAALDELDERVETRIIHGRSAHPSPPLTTGCLRPGDLREPSAWLALPTAHAYVSGADEFVDDATALLLERGHDLMQIRTERFGPEG